MIMTDEDAVFILKQLLKGKKVYWLGQSETDELYVPYENFERLITDVKYLEQHKRRWWIAD